jgi:predicted nucleotide-binding protein
MPGYERADRGRTIIEKFEAHAGQVGSAIVLLTSDDKGGAVGKPQQRRARQNVVLELGFFLATLGRERVVILHEQDVECQAIFTGSCTFHSIAREPGVTPWLANYRRQV